MSGAVRFGCYEVDLAGGQLYKRGNRVSLRDKSFQALALFLERPGQVVTREELRRRLWPGEVFVDFDNNLNSAIARLREALGDSADHPRFIETLPKRGYRFLAEVSEPHQVPETARRPSARLVVLPFLKLIGDPADECLCDSLTDELITDLASLAPGDLAVIARTTAMHYKGTVKKVADIGRDLGVDYLVEGGVRREQDRLAINIQVIQVRDQMHMFAWKYSARQGDVFRVMSRAASDVARSIGVSPRLDEDRSAVAAGTDHRKRPVDLAAYGDYIQARHFMGNASADGFAKARKLLDSALARDPEFALAYEALAEMYWYLGYFGFVPPLEAFSAGIMHALRALELDNTRAETHALLGQFHKAVEYNWPEVKREMALALRLDPTSPIVRSRYAWCWLMPQGRLEEAIAEVESALESDPLSLMLRTLLTILLLLGRQPERTLDAARQALEIDPSAYWAYVSLGGAYRDLGNLEEAVRAHRRALEISGGSAPMIGWLGLTLGLSGSAAEAGSLLERLDTIAAQRYVPPTSYAWIHLGLGEIDSAFEWLSRAVEVCDQYMMPIKSYPFFDPIRDDPRFRTLLCKMNLDK
jgi:TolB-like protein/Tfp pilus assembly protein PilF